MDIARAKELLEVLADGVNPLTGEVLSPEDSCNQVEIVRALHCVLKTLDIQPEKPKKPQAENAGKPWTPEAEDTLIRMFDEGKSKKEICDYFKRSSGAIAARLVHLGRIEDRDVFREM